jgi:soluble lytic murein transglycosylase-like protein
MKKTIGAMACLLLFKLSPAGAGDAAKHAERLRAEGLRYQQGGTAPNFKLAYNKFCEAALLGDAQSAFNLGWLYLSGHGVPRDPRRARGWFERAKQSGDPAAERIAFKLRDAEAADDPTCPTGRPLAIPSAPRMIRTSNKQIELLVLRIAARYGMDPQLVFAVMQAESGFNPAAMSPKNAQGLMQLIPATAERFGVKNVWDPAENIRGGAAYLHWLLRHFSGNVEWVLAAYNAGEQNVERYRGVPPFAETQAYVRKILANYGKATHPVPPDRPNNSAL